MNRIGSFQDGIFSGDSKFIYFYNEESVAYRYDIAKEQYEKVQTPFSVDRIMASQDSKYTILTLGFEPAFHGFPLVVIDKTGTPVNITKQNRFFSPAHFLISENDNSVLFTDYADTNGDRSSNKEAQIYRLDLKSFEISVIRIPNLEIWNLYELSRDRRSIFIAKKNDSGVTELY